MFDRAFDFVVDSTRRTAAGPLDRCSQTETAVWSGGANLAAAKVALSGVAWPCAWMAGLRSGHRGPAQPSTRVGTCSHGFDAASARYVEAERRLISPSRACRNLHCGAVQDGESQNCTSSTSLYHFTRSPIFARMRHASGLGSASRRRRRASTRETRRVFCPSSS